MELELGVLRVALTRLLVEEEDAAAMALGMTRLARARRMLVEKKARLQLGGLGVPTEPDRDLEALLAEVAAVQRLIPAWTESGERGQAEREQGRASRDEWLAGAQDEWGYTDEVADAHRVA